MNIRKITPDDRDEWLRMRNALWPDSLDDHRKEIAAFFAGSGIGIVEVWVVERPGGALGGFVELNIRDYAEGSDTGKIPYIEGWYIDADLRGSGYGRNLMETAEAWAHQNGFSELASDAELNNTRSIAAHKALGFTEVERIVCFIKKLSPKY